MPSFSSSTSVTIASRRFRAYPRAAWFGARASNVLRRRFRLLASWFGAALLVLVGYLLLPAGAQGVLALFGSGEAQWRDTTRLQLQVIGARRRLDVADASLATARTARASALAPVAAAELSPELAARRDSLAGEDATLGDLLARAERAPLAESFRTLGEAPALGREPRVRALVDSLVEVERERDELGGGATVDPVYIALTTQANVLGREIQALGEARRASLREEIDGLAIPSRVAVDSTSPLLPDTLVAQRAGQRAREEYLAARRALDAGRIANAASASAAARARARLQLAPLHLLVTAAVIIGAVLAFAVALVDEMRSPRLSNAAEAEGLTLLRVLATAQVREVPVDRSRRAADRALAPVLDPTADSYRILASHLTSQWPRDGIITVTGDDPRVAAIVASNLAAALANDARVTLLVDADFEHGAVRALLALPRSEGLAAVLANRRRWSEALLSVPTGRGRTMDVLPSGERSNVPGPAETQALIQEIQRAARRHDATIVVTSLAGAQRLRLGDDVVVCATQTRTRLSMLDRRVSVLIDGGSRVRGLVLWSGRVPKPSKEPIAHPADNNSSTQAA